MREMINEILRHAHSPSVRPSFRQPITVRCDSDPAPSFRPTVRPPLLLLTLRSLFDDWTPL